MAQSPRTSLRIAEVRPSPDSGLIGIIFAPGKKGRSLYGGYHDRDLDAELDVVAAWGAGFDERTIADALGQKTDSMARHYSRDADLCRKMTSVTERMDVAENKRRSEVVKHTLICVKP